MDPQQPTLLVCTVGGTAEPVVAAIKHWRPDRIHFVFTPQTKATVADKILPLARLEGFTLGAGHYDLCLLPDGQDLSSCLEALLRLTPTVEQWAARGDGFRVVVDYTGGTKVMSAAIGLVARQWACTFSYVGGTQRTKDSVGVVVTGTESIVHQANPWDALGHQAVDEFVVLFDQRAFAAAAGAAEGAKKRVTRDDRKRELNVLEQLAKGFDAWDRFDHAGAAGSFENVERAANDLRAVLGHDRADGVLGDLARSAQHLDQLIAATPPSRHHVLDLLANAQRRREEGRVDDAVARLYRAIEALAQVALKEDHQIGGTESVPLDRVPEALRGAWAARAEAGIVRLGLQDAYALLASLENAIGAKFRAAKLDDPTSALGARNRSILAHGFERVPDKVVTRLWAATLDLAGIEATALPSFPTLGRRAP